MRFLSKWRRPIYVVRPKYVEQIAPGVRRTIQTGLRAEFHEGGYPEGGSLDTEDEQRRLGWSDEDRQTVEQHLLNHSDFGIGIFLEELLGAEPDEAPDTVGCAFAEITDGGAERCGKRRVKNSDYCKRHHELVFPPETPRKARKPKVKAEA